MLSVTDPRKKPYCLAVSTWLSAGFCVLALAAQAATQLKEADYLVESWQRADGLPDSTISAMAQTVDGFLWLGTPKGLVRFDGVRFKIFPLPNGESEIQVGVTALFKERGGRLWVGTESGQVFRIEANGRGSARLAGSVGARVTSIAADEVGTLWVLAQDGRFPDARIHSLSPSDGAFRPGAEPDFRLTGFAMDTRGAVWGWNAGGLYMLRAGHWQKMESPGSYRFEMVGNGPEGRLYAVRGQPRVGWSLYQIESGTNATLWGNGPAVLGSPRFRSAALLEDPAGTLWLGTLGGGVYFTGANRKWQLLGGTTALGHGSVSCFLYDREGSVWIGTQSGGLYRARRKLVTDFSLPDRKFSQLVTSVCASRAGGIWVGTDVSGVFRLNEGVFTPIGAGSDFTNNPVTVLWEDRRADLWIGSRDGLWRSTNGVMQKVALPRGFFGNVRAIFEDDQGRLWAANRTRLYYRTDDNWKEVALKGVTEANPIRAVMDGGDDTVWVALQNRGIARVGLEGDMKEFLDVKNEPAIADVRALYRDRKGALWIATAGNGLVRHAEGEFTQWTTQQGLSSDDLGGVTEDANGAIWMTSSDGIIGCAKTELENVAAGKQPRLLCRQLGVDDGLEDVACSGGGQSAITQGPDGRLWFCNMRAVCSFAPGGGASFPPVAVTDEVRVDGVNYAGSDLRIPASAQRFEFHFTSAELENSRRLFFRYRLEGLDKDWVDGGNERVAYYSQLPPGSYQFRAMVGRSQHGWQSPTAPINLEIVPLWWQRRLVQIAGALALIAVIAGAVVMNERRKLRRWRERVEAQQVLENERRRIARDLHDDLGAQLTEIVLVGELAKRGEQTVAELKHQMGDMTRMTRKVVAAMQEVVWTVNPRNDSVPRLTAYLCEFVERFLAATEISHRLELQEDLPEVPLAAQVRHNVLLAFKEAVNNAVKHSGTTKIRLGIHTENELLVIVLEDDGRGFDPAKLPANSSGNGLQNMRSRLEAASGRAQITSVIGQGTEVKFEIPIGDAHTKSGSPDARTTRAA
ncbi:MAG: hypothetical protein EXS24_00540 [Pedosphaera sp.]|nr:hypothetical protein [Pedosphaera sp.]